MQEHSRTGIAKDLFVRVAQLLHVETCSLILDDDRWIDLDPKGTSLRRISTTTVEDGSPVAKSATPVKGWGGREKKIRHTLSLLPEEIREWIKGVVRQGPPAALPGVMKR